MIHLLRRIIKLNKDGKKTQTYAIQTVQHFMKLQRVKKMQSQIYTKQFRIFCLKLQEITQTKLQTTPYFLTCFKNLSNKCK